MSDMCTKVGKNIRKLRIAKDWSQETLAFECGLHRAYIGQIERAEKVIGIINLEIIANALNTTCSELLQGDRKKDDDKT